MVTIKHPTRGTVRLGKKPKRSDARTLQLRKYLPKLAAPPALVSWITKVPTPWAMLGNDLLGDCVEAAQLHIVKQLTFFAGKPFIPTDAQAIALYSAEAGYVPGDPNTDRGTDMLTALNYWRQNGAAGHRIAAFAEVNPANDTEIRQAIQLFGNVFIGLNLPTTIQDANGNMLPSWTVPSGGPFGAGSPGSLGGHCVPVMASSPLTKTCVTWGGLLKMSNNFFLDYCDECYAVISQDWIEAAGKSPSGFDLTTLLADLKTVSI